MKWLFLSINYKIPNFPKKNLKSEIRFEKLKKEKHFPLFLMVLVYVQNFMIFVHENLSSSMFLYHHLHHILFPDFSLHILI
jgi:hypothetical protein